MKALGIVRKLDQLGRIVIPKETRDVMGMSERDALEIFTEGDAIILKKYSAGCIFCGEIKGTSKFKDALVCTECRKALK